MKLNSLVFKYYFFFANAFKLVEKEESFKIKLHSNMSSTSPTKPGKQSSSSTVHQKLSLLTASGSTSSSSSKPFIKNKSQTTSSLTFPSFRFSPDSEEIQEITTDGGGEAGDEVRRASVSGGEGGK